MNEKDEIIDVRGTIRMLDRAVALAGTTERSFALYHLRYGGDIRNALKCETMSLKRYRKLREQLSSYIREKEEAA